MQPRPLERYHRRVAEEPIASVHFGALAPPTSAEPLQETPDLLMLRRYIAYPHNVLGQRPLHAACHFQEQSGGMSGALLGVYRLDMG